MGKVRPVPWLYLFLILPLFIQGQVTRTSVQTGNWNNAATWDTGVPNAGDNVVIDSGHTVTMTANHAINDVTVKATGRLDDNGMRPDISGNLVLNGTYIGSGRTSLVGTGTVIDGIGAFSTTGNSRVIITNNKTIPVAANLTFLDDTKGRFDLSNATTTITNLGTVTVDGNRFGGPGSWVNDVNAVLRIGGDRFTIATLDASATGNTVEYYGTKAQEIKCPSASIYHHLTISGTSTKLLFCNLLINGNLNLNSGTLDVDAANNYSINIRGDWTNVVGTFEERSATVIFDGSVVQTITGSLGETFFNLTIDKSGGTLVLVNDIAVDGSGGSTLSMNKGNINASSGTLRLGIANEGTLTRVSGTVIGKFERYISTVAPASFLFPVGTAAYYRPAILTFSALSPGHLGCEFIASGPGNNGLPLFDSPDSVFNTFVEGYWSFTPGSATPLSSADYDAGLTGNGFSSFTINPSTRILRRGAASEPWTAQGAHIGAIAPTAYRNTLPNGFPAQHAFGDTTNCTGPSTSAIAGDNDVCTNDAGEVYLVTATPGSVYNWTITGGIQASGGFTNSITVDWGSTGMTGNVRVVENNGCTDGAPVDLPVAINTLAPASITGKMSVPESATGEPYSVVSRPGYTYAWTITGGTQASGGSTNSITVDWGTAGPGNVRVVAGSACGSAAPVDLPVNIYVVISSIATGSWNNTTTWDCSCTPLASDNVVIRIGHTVSLAANTKINNMTINSGGVFDPNGRNMEVAGDFTVNGEYGGNGAGHVLTLSGINTALDGVGTISNPGGVLFNTGAKTILNTASITKSAGAMTINGVTVTNNGIITLNGNLIGNSGTSIWKNSTSSTLNIGGTLLATGVLNASAPGNTVNYTASAPQTFKLPDASTYYNLTASGSGVKSLSGDLAINGNVIITGTSQLDAVTYDISVGGDWTNSSGNPDPFNEKTQTITFNGSTDQALVNLNGETFYNLIVNKASGVLFSNDNVTVTNALTMSAGNISMGSDTLMVGTSTLAPGTLNHTSGTVNGVFRKWVNATGSYLLPVGTGTYYRPALVTINTLAAGGSLAAQFNIAVPGESGLPLTDIGPLDSIRHAFTEGTWDMTALNGLNSGNYDLSLTGNGFSSFNFNAGTRALKRIDAAGSWTTDGNHLAASGKTARRTSLTGGIAAQFGLGDTSDCVVPVTSAITGPDSVCTGTAGQLYSVVDSGSTYTWTVTGGIIVSGQLTSSISVNWGTTGMAGNVKVVENNGCSNGAEVNLGVNIHALPTSSITGFDDVAELSDSVAYSVAANTGYTYTWSITGGTLILGQGSYNILVNWGSAGSGNVRVIGSTPCGSATAVDLPVNVYKTIKSNGTGNWSTPSSWDCNCVPLSTDNVIILGDPVYHTVTLTGNTTINNIVLQDGATVFDNSFNMTVNGDLAIEGNGLYTGSGDLILGGVNKNLDGTGRIATTGTVQVINGNKNIPSSASIILSPGNVRIDPGITVTSSGYLVVAGNLDGASLSSTFTNTANASLVIGGNLLTTGTLNASASENTVNYNGSSGQAVKPTDYYNLSSTGVSTTTLSTNLSVSGDVLISPTNTFDAAGFNISVKGNWTNSGGTFVAGTGGVIFDGAGPQTITRAGGETFNNLTINTGSIVSTTGANDNINIKGNWTNNGSFNAQTGSVTFSGSSAQSIGGAAKTTFNDLIITNAAGASLSAATDLVRTLTLSSGTFNTAGQLFTLISNAAGTANIGEITGGAITGNITMQRYIAGDDDWRILASPVSVATLAGWNTNFSMAGFPGSNAPGMSFVSVYSYDETALGVKEVGYVAPSGIGDALGIGKGWFTWVGQMVGMPIAITTDLTGPATTGPQNIPTTYTDDPATADDEDGWNLIGNPYPSDILWDGVTLSNVRPFAYVWDPNGDSYVSYDQSSGKTIPSMQAFWVKGDTPGAGTVTINESDKAADGNNFYKTSQIPGMSLILQGNGFTDSTRIRLNAQATSYYDPLYDAYAMYSLNETKANLSTVTPDSVPVDLSINSIPELDGDVTVPVRIGFSAAGATNNYTLTANINAMPQGACTLLEDLFTSSVTDLRVNNSYSFTQAAAKNLPPRFLLHIGGPLTASIRDVGCHGMSDGRIVASSPGNNLTYTWLNMNGDTLKVTSVASGPDTLEGMPSGDYSVIVNRSGSICPVVEETYSISEPDPLTLTHSLVNPKCQGDSTGSIDVSISGGTPPYSHQWSGGATSEDLHNLPEGTYQILLADSNGCYLPDSFILSNPSQIIDVVDVVNESCATAHDGAITISTTGGVSPYQYLWNDGVPGSLRNNLSDGNYSVTVTDDNGCVVEETGIFVEPGLQVMAGYTVPTSTVLLSEGGSLQFSNLSMGATSYYWDFGTGESSTLGDPMYNFSYPGEYEVILTAYNGPCSSSSANFIKVIENVGIDGPEDNFSSFSAYESNGMLVLNIPDQLTGTIDLFVYNVLGQTMFSYMQLGVNRGDVILSLMDLPGGVYTVQVRNEFSSRSIKFTIR